ncbi:MAG: 30S ribosomal protein S12 methylthiotransferase RimO [Bacteroidales bacterium]|nr:30S ribosomal protein S12 methylthiotransferase RimO [Bacteroidales bacterium]
MHKKKLAIITLGCSKNLVDSEDIATRIHSRYDVVFDDDNADADIVLINTCGFILDAKQESIDTIMEYINLKNEGRIQRLFVFGCLSQRYKKELAADIPEVDEFFGVDSLREILDRLDCDDLSKSVVKEPRMISTPQHTAYIKVSEGCDRYCAFCAIPYIRGHYVSRPMDEIIDEVTRLAKNGTREFNLIAQDLSYYGKDLYGDFRLPELVEALAAIEGVKWIRLHYTYPNNFPLRTLDIMRDNPKVCKYLDIPLQHINDNVLDKMKRGHSRAETLALLKKFREIVPDITLRTTLLVGFPGETDKAFEELVDFVKETKFDRLGVFPYSEEEGTYSAEHYKDRISKKKKQERADRIMSIQQKISLQLNVNKIGKCFEIVIDRDESGYWVGRTQYDSPEVDCEVLVNKQDAPDFQIGGFYNVVITDAEEFDLYARPV